MCKKYKVLLPLPCKGDRVVAERSHSSHKGSKTMIKTAILSVSDKAGLVDFAQFLASKRVMLISTGGTAKTLRGAYLRVVGVSEYTGFPEMMDGRVKTLHPKVHGGLLAVRDNSEHVAAMQAHGIKPVDMLVVNFYPFAETVLKADVTEQDANENIDIGGPAMVRSAAKNHKFVTVVTSPSQYRAVMVDMRVTGATSLGLRRRLKVESFKKTAQYDAQVAAYFNKLYRYAMDPIP